MKQQLKYIIFCLTCLFCFASCQTEIDIELPDYKDAIVIEGYIENGKPPMVMLTKSIPYFAPIDLETLMDKVMIVDAKVTVSSNTGESTELHLQLMEEAPFGIAFTNANLIGECGKDYTLTVEYDNKVYTSKTSIVHTFDLDSIWLQPFGTEKDSVRTVRCQFTDNAATVDYYQFSVKVSGEKVKDRLWAFSLPIVADDKLFNGLTFNYEIVRTSPSTLFAFALSEEERGDYFRPYYKPGDTIYAKRSLMDYNSYRFWSTAASEIGFGMSAFMSPPPIETNIKCLSGDKVLGVWCGYASKVDTLIYEK